MCFSSYNLHQTQHYVNICPLTLVHLSCSDLYFTAWSSVCFMVAPRQPCVGVSVALELKLETKGWVTFRLIPTSADSSGSKLPLLHQNTSADDQVLQDKAWSCHNQHNRYNFTHLVFYLKLYFILILFYNSLYFYKPP